MKTSIITKLIKVLRKKLTENDCAKNRYIEIMGKNGLKVSSTNLNSKAMGMQNSKPRIWQLHLLRNIPKWTTPFSCRGGLLSCQLLREL
jgi:hypothetical protein